MLIIDQMIKADEEVFLKVKALIVSLHCAPKGAEKSILSITVESIPLSVTLTEVIRIES